MKTITKYLLILITMNVNAQNLVPNPSFEDTVQCPNHGGNIDQAVGWINCGITPDYYNSCANLTAPALGVPDGGYSGFQYAFDGNAYAGFETYENPVIQHEFIGIELLQPLTIGVTYYASCFIVKSDYYLCAANNFGFRFFTTIPFSTTIMAPIDNFSHIHFSNIISDAVNWQHLFGSFVADSAYQYLVLGNFYDNTNTNVLQCDTAHVDGAYYLIDAVCVSDDSLACSNWNNINDLEAKDVFQIFPNPANQTLHIEGKFINEEYIIENILGEMIDRGFISNSTNINVRSLPIGLYYISINGKKRKFLVYK
jgi:hypothetical protein